MRRLFWAWAGLVLVFSARAEVEVGFDANSLRWYLSNGVIRATFQLGADGRFGLKQITNTKTGTAWQAAAGASPIRVQLDSIVYSADTPFRLVGQSTSEVKAGGRRQTIILEDLRASGHVTVELEIYPDQPVLRHRVSVTNLTAETPYAVYADLMPYAFVTAAPLRVFHVDQWDVLSPANFQPHEDSVGWPDAAVTIDTGAPAKSCTWVALRNDQGAGLFAGWEFDGRAQARISPGVMGESINLSAAIAALHHPVAPGETFTLPAGFLGLFEGDWDQAGYRTQRFVEMVLARPAPLKFPSVSWDSWAYHENIDETTLRANAVIAGKLGMELFVVDLGWARQLGDWHDDPAKFPSGLRALSDEVHRQGMKFGLHFALAEVARDAPVLLEHPDWTASESSNYFGALSLCLSNRPTREWLVREAVRMIDDYGVDYILQDGENIVKLCRRTDHTHDPDDSNYSNSVDGIDWVIAEIQRQRPNVLWENCEDGGHMMTFNMVQHYDTSITNDASGALGSRQGVWGATYPFSPRFADRYMPEDPSDSYVTRSYMFGGPWHFMNQLASMTVETSAFAAREIVAYKNIRDLIVNGQVFHLTPPPGQGSTDALESYDGKTDSAVAIVTREDGPSDWPTIRLQGLNPDVTYIVHFQDDSRVLAFSGRQLMLDGVRVSLPQTRSAEIVYADSLR